jgi:thiamine-monophosphate kinase
MLGHKTLAVNLSDLAAMGATPRWVTLALSLPQADEVWLRQFSDGFFALAERHGVELVGGDTTRGPLNMCVTIMGEVPQSQALRRDGAKVDDDIWVSGVLGNAALGLAQLQGKIELPVEVRLNCLSALHQPEPRVALGTALLGMAHSAIDVSDGLLADLGHILECSKVGAEIFYDALPCLSFPQGNNRLEEEGLIQYCILAGGDDYELCFTAPPLHRVGIETLSAKLRLPLTRIGKIMSGDGCKVRAGDGSEIKIKESGYDHFHQ